MALTMLSMPSGWGSTYCAIIFYYVSLRELSPLYSIIIGIEKGHGHRASS